MFEWGETKNRANIKKHGIDFETAQRIFERDILTQPDNRQDYGEKRFTSIGAVDDAAILVVTHTDREGRIRLISARPASRRERKMYNDHIR